MSIMCPGLYKNMFHETDIYSSKYTCINCAARWRWKIDGACAYCGYGLIEIDAPCWGCGEAGLYSHADRHYCLDCTFWHNVWEAEWHGEITNYLRERLFSHYEWKCLSCGMETDALTVDHIVPRSSGTIDNSVRNLQPLCKPCNSRKGNRHQLDYRPDKNEPLFWMYILFENVVPVDFRDPAAPVSWRGLRGPREYYELPAESYLVSSH